MQVPALSLIDRLIRRKSSAAISLPLSLWIAFLITAGNALAQSPPYRRLPAPQGNRFVHPDPWAQARQVDGRWAPADWSPDGGAANAHFHESNRTGSPYITPVAYPTRVGEEIVDDFSHQRPPRSPGGPRNGFFQKLRLSGGWSAGDPVSDFGLTDIDANLTVALPFPTRDAPLIITPGFQTTFLDGPTTPDMPARVYDSYIKFRALRKLNDRWGMDVAVTPGWYSDLKTSNDDALRITGHAFVGYDWTENLQAVLGVAYLDRSDFSVVPLPGLIWTIDKNTRMELIMPRPRFARRFIAERDEEYWWYFAGEFGGGRWAIERASGAEDVVNYREVRIVLGWERKVCQGFGSHFEIGYAFLRKLEYDSTTPDFRPDGTLLVRGGITY